MPAPSESLQMLNPDVYLNHVSPTTAHEMDIRRDITLIVLGATLWDILTYFHIDMAIVRDGRFTFVKGCFLSSRLFAIGHIFLVANLDGDQVHTWSYVVSACLCTLSMMASSFLFLQRVLAIYSEHTKVRWGFCIAWVLATSSDIVLLMGGHEKAAPGTNQYQHTEFPTWYSTSSWCLFLFDSAVLIAASYKVLSTWNIYEKDEAFSWFDFLTGRKLPALSRVIFRGGVQYYVITVGLTLLAGFVFVLSSVPQIYKGTAPTAVVPLMASMACRVFRNTKLFYSEDPVIEFI